MNDFASLDASDLNFLALLLCFHRNIDSMYIIETTNPLPLPNLTK